MAKMKLGTKGDALIKYWEKLKLVGYLDGGGVPTIGWGHTGYGVRVGKKITKEVADALFDTDTSSAVAIINKLVTVPLTQNQFDTLVTFTYNVGNAAFAGSTLLKKLNAKLYAEVPAQLSRWNKDNGKVVKGLINRRNAEIELWNSK